MRNQNSDSDLRKILFSAITNNNGDLIREILGENTVKSINFLMDFGYSPLEYALEISSLDAAKVLIELEFGLNMRVALFPLESAISFNHIEMVEILLAAGIDVNRDLGGGWTFLMRAAISENLQAAKLLVDAGADAGKVTQEGWIAHSIALREGFAELAGYLESLMTF
ncbi:ankyrin repeat domain-containing protein [Kovacikia minuta CCNUW1]|uniref:ankyrin repeat domain-containing protein n=1 Tax=Kovacikia minuta TaxID=2931930 RepID=UPI001CCB9020|nr:ankyrin repeat domain-containing protein [Kovacikia minuta]UBF27120.1 ankyrin repeat domain-containing protein [Kovacikia minuta CCNUW1]